MTGGDENLPNEAHDGAIEGLLETEPESWVKNREFPTAWHYLIHDICRDKTILFLSFDLTPDDKAYVVDRAHIERELYRESKGQGKSTPRTMNEACRNYWKSRIPLFEYNGDYDMPQLAIWQKITPDRLNVDKVFYSDKFWHETNRQTDENIAMFVDPEHVNSNEYKNSHKIRRWPEYYIEAEKKRQEAKKRFEEIILEVA